jgi:hypothetical protein
MAARTSVATTTIQIDVEVQAELRARGRMGESYNDVIRRLLAVTRFIEGGPTGTARDAVAPTPEPLVARRGPD